MCRYRCSKSHNIHFQALQPSSFLTAFKLPHSLWVSSQPLSSLTAWEFSHRLRVPSQPESFLTGWEFPHWVWEFPHWVWQFPWIKWDNSKPVFSDISKNYLHNNNHLHLCDLYQDFTTQTHTLTQTWAWAHTHTQTSTKNTHTHTCNIVLQTAMWNNNTPHIVHIVTLI